MNLAPISDVTSKFSDMTFPPMCLGQFCITVIALASDELRLVPCQAHHVCLVHGPGFEFYSPEVDNQPRDSPSWLLATPYPCFPLLILLIYLLIYRIICFPYFISLLKSHTLSFTFCNFLFLALCHSDLHKSDASSIT